MNAECGSSHSSMPFTPPIDLEFDRDQQGQRISLGQGAYGKVYLAQDRITSKKFAVKEIPMRNPSHTEVVENEIKTLSTLNHKNRQLSEASIRNYTRQILKDLQYLHENHILHRDIKSANILINSRGEIKIADFGTSKRLAGLHLCTEENVGTLQYMCPDVVLVTPIGYGSEVDIWSVGCTVIEMATGKRPFHNVANGYALLFKLGKEKQPSDIPSELSDTTKDFLAKCFEPSHRRPSAKDLLNHPLFNAIRVSDSSSSLQQSTNDDGVMVFEPACNLAPQVSIDGCRRLELANILCDKESREAVHS
ncbi:unnamed protein product, partial [Rotaria sordida]